MCKIYNTIGSLISLKSGLERNNIHDFKSLKDVLDFQRTYTSLQQQLLDHHACLIEHEKDILQKDLVSLSVAIETQTQQSKQQLTDEINRLRLQLSKPTNFFQQLVKGLKNRSCQRKIKRKEANFDINVALSVSSLVQSYQTKQSRHHFITAHTAEAARKSAQQSLSELERKKAVIDELNPFIYGAIGEQKVVKTLETLPDDYFLINNFDITFSPPVYYKQDDTYITKVQIDHILVSPSGIFLIETKNWSDKSLQSLSLRSPVQQIRRANFALFKLLNYELSNGNIGLTKHHWGDKKVSIKNLVVLTNSKPKEEFQYVKVLTSSQLIGYVTYFQPLFSNAETQRIAELLIGINDRKTISIK